MRRPAGAHVVAAVALALLAGCGPDRQVASTAEPVTVLLDAPSEPGRAVRLGGELEVLGGCLGVAGTLVTWPAGTEVVEQDPVVVEVPGLGRLREGQTTDLGEGRLHEASGTTGRDLYIEGLTIPPGCAAYDLFSGWVPE